MIRFASLLCLLPILAFGVDTPAILAKLEPVLLAEARKDGVDPAGIARVLAKVEKGYGLSMRETVAKILAEADHNRDGSLTKDEWLGYKKIQAPAAKAPTPPGGGKEEDRALKVMLPMGDGKRLATYVTFPEGKGPFPVLLERTPYRADFKRKSAGNGYAWVVQDQRGRFASEGENFPFIGCGWAGHQDGAETLAWIRKQPWCNGKVGTTGASALGITQMFLAATTKAVDAQFIIVAAPDLYGYAAYHGGALFKSQIEGWVTGNKYDPAAKDLYLSHPFYDESWAPYDSLSRSALMDIPAVHEGGWFDTFSQGTLDGYLARQTNGGPRARGAQRLIMGPWGHGGHQTNICGEMTFPNGAFPKGLDPITYFNWMLKGEANGYDKASSVSYYVMGDVSDPGAPGNRWRHTDRWPPPSKSTPWYLVSGHSLANSIPAEAQDTILVDPSNFCPTIGGRNLNLPKGPMDQRKVDGRADVLCYDSAPLASPLEVTGRIGAKIHVSTSARDTDIHVRLCDVYPDGRSFLMVDGIRRLSVREGRTRSSPVVPGEVYEVDIDLWSTSIVFNKGHRMRFTVEGSSYPRFDLNPGTGKRQHEGGPVLIQTNRFYLGGAQGSRVILPVVEGTGS